MVQPRNKVCVFDGKNVSEKLNSVPTFSVMAEPCLAPSDASPKIRGRS